MNTDQHPWRSGCGQWQSRSRPGCGDVREEGSSPELQRRWLLWCPATHGLGCVGCVLSLSQTFEVSIVILATKPQRIYGNTTAFLFSCWRGHQTNRKIAIIADRFPRATLEHWFVYPIDLPRENGMVKMPSYAQLIHYVLQTFKLKPVSNTELLCTRTQMDMFGSPWALVPQPWYEDTWMGQKKASCMLALILHPHVLLLGAIPKSYFPAGVLCTSI